MAPMTWFWTKTVGCHCIANRQMEVSCGGNSHNSGLGSWFCYQPVTPCNWQLCKRNYARVYTPSVITYRYANISTVTISLRSSTNPMVRSKWWCRWCGCVGQTWKRRRVKRQLFWLSAEIVAAMQVRNKTIHRIDGIITGYGVIMYM